jgi:hypothetical protein
MTDNSEGEISPPQNTSNEDSPNENKKLSISEVLDELKSAYRDAYNDSVEIQNYNQDGSEFPRMNEAQVLKKITKDALSKGLDPSQTLEFMKGASIWPHLSSEQRIELERELCTSPLSKDNWFKLDKDGNPKEFVPHQLALDYLRVYPDVLTEYDGRIHQFIGNRWLRDAEGFIASKIERTADGSIRPRQILEGIESLRNITRVSDPESIEKPLSFIRPLPPHTIPITSGLLNARTKILEPHSASYYYTEVLPRSYLPGAVPEYFLAFLDKMFSGDPNKDLKKTQILEVIAWTLTEGYSIQGAVVFYGPGGEGKSILHSLLGYLLVHVTSLTLKELETDKFKRAELDGSWANLISESNSDVITSEWFKRVTDGTVFTADRKNGHPFQMSSRAKMILDVNELPNKENELRAFYRRVIAIIDFPNRLEDVLSPQEIENFINKMKDPAELDKVFSYVIDNYYGPLADRLKFTGQLSISEAEKKWEERSNPAASYLKTKNEAGQIYTDVEQVMGLLSGESERFKRYVTEDGKDSEGNTTYCLTMVKNDVIDDAIKWAGKRGFPAKTVNGKSIGSALYMLGLPNETVNKKVGRGTVLKAWKNIYIDLSEPLVAVEGGDPENTRYRQKVLAINGNLSTVADGFPFPDHVSKNQNIMGEREGTATSSADNVKIREKSEVAGENKGSATEPLPDDPEESPYLIRVCTQNPGHLNPFKKLRKGMPFRIHKNEISSYNFYDFSKEPEKGEVSEKDEDIHFIETFKAAEIPDRLMRVKQELLLVLHEKPVKSIGILQRKLSDLEPDLSLADISAAVKELMAMGLVHKSEDGRYMPGKEDVA